MSKVEPGDFYFSDGTFADKNDGLTPEQANACIGIVFFVKQHDSDKSDYSNTGIGQEKCNGYVVALTDVHTGSYDRLNWENDPNDKYDRIVGASTLSDDWNGYYNCMKIHEFVDNNTADGWEMKHFPAALACETYGNRKLDENGEVTNEYSWQQPFSAPDNTSGWFLPSAGQLTYIYYNKALISSQMDMVKSCMSNDKLKKYIQWFSAKDYSSNLYWSSSEKDGYNAYSVFFGIGRVYSSDKRRTYGVRAVLAF